MEVIGGGRELEGGGVVAFDGDHWLLAVQFTDSVRVGGWRNSFGFWLFKHGNFRFVRFVQPRVNTTLRYNTIPCLQMSPQS